MKNNPNSPRTLIHVFPCQPRPQHSEKALVISYQARNDSASRPRIHFRGLPRPDLTSIVILSPEDYRCLQEKTASAPAPLTSTKLTGPAPTGIKLRASPFPTRLLAPPIKKIIQSSWLRLQLNPAPHAPGNILATPLSPAPSPLPPALDAFMYKKKLFGSTPTVLPSPPPPPQHPNSTGKIPDILAPPLPSLPSLRESLDPPLASEQRSGPTSKPRNFTGLPRESPPQTLAPPPKYYEVGS